MTATVNSLSWVSENAMAISMTHNLWIGKRIDNPLIGWHVVPFKCQ